MSDFKIITEKHPAPFLYFKFLKENFARSTYFKGSLKLNDLGTVYEAHIFLEKYIPKTFILIGFLGFIGAGIISFLGQNPLFSWVLAIPGLLFLFSYWILQSKLFYYGLVYLALRKRGYYGAIILRGL